MDKKVFFNTTVSENLIKEFKVLAVQQGRRQNQLLEEAIQDLLNKYERDTNQLEDEKLLQNILTKANKLDIDSLEIVRERYNEQYPNTILIEELDKLIAQKRGISNYHRQRRCLDKEYLEGTLVKT
jgi:hypothetical protein